MKNPQRTYAILICALMVISWASPKLLLAQEQEDMTQSTPAKQEKPEAASSGKNCPKSIRETGGKASSTGPNDDYDYCGDEETCGTPQWNSGQTKIRCRKVNACSNSGTGCECNVFTSPSGPREWERIGGENAWHDHSRVRGNQYVCYCTVKN